ncbi:hypothetical protein [Pseudomonas shirazensis]|uniref:hypothetical protein n=1 Tax=Pseudomonas shirazensis TaxID=2745494 RepID=UPI003D29421A
MATEDKPAGYAPDESSAVGRQAPNEISHVSDPSDQGSEGGVTPQGDAPLIRFVNDSWGLLPWGEFTVDKSVTVMGWARKGEIELFDDGKSIAKVPVRQNGEFIASIGGLDARHHSIVAVRVQEPDAKSEAYEFEVVEDLGRPHIRLITDVYGTVPYEGDALSKQITVSGTASTDEQIELFDNEKSFMKVTANSSGEWSTPINSLGDGRHELVAVGKSGTGLKSRVYQFSIAKPLGPSIQMVYDEHNKNVHSGGVTYSTKLKISGISHPRQRVELFDGDTYLDEITTHYAINWSITLSDVAIGHHVLKLVGRYANEPVSDTYSFEVRQKAP